MKLLWFTWKDPWHPQAGGAEVVQAELCRQLVANGHKVTVVTSHYAGAASEEERGGVRYLRGGSIYTVGVHGFVTYWKQLRGWADIVVEEVNTGPFLSRFYVREPQVLFYHQMAREIWFYQVPLIFSPIGYVAEAVATLLQRGRPVITVSDSTKRDLMKFGFKSADIRVISEGITLESVAALAPKPAERVVLSLGAVRPMKRTLEVVKAFEIAHEQQPDLRLQIAGDTTGAYAETVLAYIAASPHATAITVHGRVSHEEKMRLMRDAHLIAVTSLKEGWGLIVTEANSQGTPAVVYNVDGLRDSVQDGTTGLIAAENTPASLAAAMSDLLADAKRYETLRHAAWEWSKTITFARSYADFMNIITPYVK